PGGNDVRRWRHRMLLILLLGMPAGCAGIGRERVTTPGGTTIEAGVPLPTPEEEGGSAQALPVLGPSSTLEDYLAYAALKNPDLKAAFHAWKAELEKIPQVERLPDPRFTYAYFIRNVETRVGPQRHKFGISQLFPWFGKLRLQGDVQFEKAEAARQRYEARKWRLFYEVRKAYSAYYDLGRSIEITKENIALLDYLEQVARARYQVGSAGYADVIKAQVEQGVLADRLRTLEEQIPPLAAELNAQLNNPLDFPLPIPRTVPEEVLDVPEAQLFAWLADSNPEIQALAAEVRAGERRKELAEKRFYPDVMFGLDYIETGTSPADPPENGKDPIVAAFSLNLPIWRESYRAGVRQALEETSALRLRRIERINLLGARLKTALFNYHDADRKVRLYRNTLIPKAEQSLKATESAF
ncbi:MAG: TolC family protein, partial [Deltaproteobacteria bacterium]